jgi:hypothetical protein
MSKCRGHIAEQWLDDNGELLSANSHTETVEADNADGAKQAVTDYLVQESPEDAPPYVEPLDEADPNEPVTFPPPLCEECGSDCSEHTVVWRTKEGQQ